MITAEEGVNVRLMDPFTIKPIDKEAILANAKECGGKIITVEDHYPEVTFPSFLTLTLDPLLHISVISGRNRRRCP